MSAALEKLVLSSWASGNEIAGVLAFASVSEAGVASASFPGSVAGSDTDRGGAATASAMEWSRGWSWKPDPVAGDVSAGEWGNNRSTSFFTAVWAGELAPGAFAAERAFIGESGGALCGSMDVSGGFT